MPYSKKLSDLVAYYSMCIPLPEYGYVTSTDNSRVIDFCSRLEGQGLSYMGNPFKIDENLIKVPIYNADFEPTGNYHDWLDPLLPFDIISQNLQDPFLEVKLPENSLAWLAKRFLENLAKAKIDNRLLLASKEKMDYNSNLDGMLDEYVLEIGSKDFFSWALIGDAIYAKFPQPLAPMPGQKLVLDLYSGPASELSEEEIVKNNLIGFLSAIESGSPVQAKGNTKLN